MVAIIIISFLKLPLIFEGSKTLDIVAQVSLDRGYSPLLPHNGKTKHEGIQVGLRVFIHENL